MNWQYRTILFEFQKDGILGDRYIDDDDMEKVLNEQGRQGWELVSVTPVQEGLLSFFKRALQQARKPVPALHGEPAGKGIREKQQPGRTVPPTPHPRPQTAPSPTQKQIKKTDQKPNGVGGIKIS